jgi:hypothetical protein
VLGADASKRENWEGSFSQTDTFHEPFMLFGYLAGLTEKIQMTRQEFGLDAIYILGLPPHIVR